MSLPNTLEAGRYILQSHVGDGPVTVVFRAFDQRERKWRAAKLLQPELAQRPELRTLLEHEANDVRALTHRNVARVYDAGSDHENAWIIMGLYERASLAERLLEEGVLGPRAALDVVVQVCHGVHAAHRMGVVHGNIKPSNVFYTARQQLKVADFACLRNSRVEFGARALDEIAWMAPEARVDPISADERADIYSVGALLFTLLTGDPPPDDLDDAIASLPVALSLIVQKATATSAGDRFASITDVIRALEMVGKTLPDEPAEPAAHDLDSDEVATEEYDENRLLARIPGMPRATPTPTPKPRVDEDKDGPPHQDRLNREATPTDANDGSKQDDGAKAPPLPWVPRSARRGGGTATPIGFGRVTPTLDPDLQRVVAPTHAAASTTPVAPSPAATPAEATPTTKSAAAATPRHDTRTPADRAAARTPPPDDRAIGAPPEEEEEEETAWERMAETAKFLANPARFLILPAVAAFAIVAYVLSTGSSTVRLAEREAEIQLHGLHSALKHEVDLPDDLISLGAQPEPLAAAELAYRDAAEGPARDQAALKLTAELEKQFVLLERMPADPETLARHKLVKKRLDRLSRSKREVESAGAAWEAATQTFGGDLAVSMGLAEGPP